jgi:hypothetical protein
MARYRPWLRQPLSWKRGGAVALAVLAMVIVAALVLDAGGGAEMRPIEAMLQEEGRAPIDVVESAGRAAQVVLLSDIHGVAGPKRLAAQVIRRMAEGPGLDAVVLEVPSDEQPYIDAFLSRSTEDAAALLARPRAVRERGGAGAGGRDFLDIYRAVWQVNQEMGAARRIRVIAVDHPAWPPPDGASPQDIAELYSQRADHMLQRMDDEILTLMPEARVLVFMDGYMTLQRSHGRLRFAGGADHEVHWLGELLRARAPAVTRTVLVDAAAPATAGRMLPEYHGTALHRPLRRALDRSAGVRVDETFTGVRSPILETSSPGLRLEITPTRYSLHDVADAYIFLHGRR